MLHQNKGDFNARGHIGTELINKAETTISVTPQKNEDVSKVEIEFCRNKAFEPFAFCVNDKGLPEIVSGWTPPAKKSKSKQTPVEVGGNIHEKILQEISSKIGDKPKHSDVVIQIKLAVSSVLQPIGDTLARDFLMYYKNGGCIKKHGKDRSPKAYYSIHPEVLNV